MKNKNIIKRLLTLAQFFMLAGILVYVFPQVINAQPQPQNIRFAALSSEDGISNNWVHSIYQDKFGFIWIGTENGLDRYDGYGFREYKKDTRNKHTLNNNSICYLFEDSRGNLWIGTRQGLDLYDRQTEKFIHDARLPQSWITSIVEDEKNILWIGTYTGLYYFDLKNDKVGICRLPGNGNISDNIIKAVFLDSKNNLWIGTDTGLLLYDRITNLFTKYNHDENNHQSLNDDKIVCILEDKAGRMWIGTSAGLELFTNARENPSNGKFIHFLYDSKKKNGITNGMILSLLEDRNSNLWIGTDNGGLDILDLKTFNEEKSKFIHYRNEPDKTNNISSNNVNAILEDTQGNIWISTFGKGINIVRRYNEKFIHYKNEIDKNNSLSNNQVNTFLEEKDDIWIGTQGGLNRYNKKEGTFKHYVHNPLDKASIGSNAVWAICKDKNGNLWIGTWAGGLNRFDYRTETFEHFNFNAKDSTSISSNNIFSIYEDSKGNLWIGTMGGGLNLFDRVNKKFTRYDRHNSGIPSNWVLQVLETKDGTLWLGMDEIAAFEKFDPKTKMFEHFIHNVNDSTSKSGDAVTSLFEDSKQNLWIGTNAGLKLFQRSTKKYICYGIEYGLPDNLIHSICEDNHGNLWLSTDKGLSKFINAVNIPAKPKFRNYNLEDGLQGNVFVHRSSYKTVDGKMYFGGTNGFNEFDPDNVVDNNYVPPIVITDFQIFSKPVPIGEKGSPLQKSILTSNELVLSYDQSMFSFDFAALSYISSAKNEFAYKMEGFDKDWIYIGTKHSATYTNLDPGKYIFRVKGSNNDGVWNEEGISLPIIITPPFWKTIWFYGLLIIVIGAIAYQVYRWRVQIRNLAEKKSIEEVIAKERNLLRALIDTVPDRIYVKDIEGRFIIYNIAVERKLGIGKPEQIIGKTDFDFYSPELAAKYHNDDQMVIKSGQPLFNREESTVDSAGNPKWTLTTKVPLRDSQGQIIGLVGTGSDITERKQMEEALAKERNLLRTLIDNLPDAVFVKDNEGKKIIANPVDLRFMGAESEKDVIGKTDFDFYPADEAASYYAADQSVIKSGVPIINGESYIIDKQGNKIDTLYFKIPLRDEQGKVVGLVGVAHDITNLKRIQESLQKERTILRTLIDNIPDAIYIKDEKCRKIIVNPADIRNLGLQSEAEAIGKDDYDFFPKELAEGFYADDQSVIQTGVPVLNREEYVLGENMQKRWLLTSKLPLHDDKGQIIGLIGIGRDITNRKLVEEALRESEERFRITAEQTGRLVYDYRLETGNIAWAGAVQEVTGYTPGEYSTSTIIEWRNNIHPEDCEHAVSQINESYKTTGNYLIEYRFRRKDGEYIYIEDQGALLKDEKGKSVRVLGAIANITERKRVMMERERLIKELQEKIADIKILSGLVPICASCKKIRDDKGYWTQLEGYIQAHTEAKFSHGVCPDCMKKMYPNFVPKKTE